MIPLLPFDSAVQGEYSSKCTVRRFVFVFFFISAKHWCAWNSIIRWHCCFGARWTGSIQIFVQSKPHFARPHTNAATHRRIHEHTIVYFCRTMFLFTFRHDVENGIDVDKRVQHRWNSKSTHRWIFRME